MKTHQSPDPRLSAVFIEGVFGCEDAAFSYLLNGHEVGQVQLCGSSDGYRHGYGVTIEIPGKPNHFWVKYEYSSKKKAEAALMERLLFYGILKCV